MIKMRTTVDVIVELRKAKKLWFCQNWEVDNFFSDILGDFLNDSNDLSYDFSKEPRVRSVLSCRRTVRAVGS